MQNRPEVLVNIARYTARSRIRTARGNGRETERYNAIPYDSAKCRYGRAHLARTSTREAADSSQAFHNYGSSISEGSWQRRHQRVSCWRTQAACEIPGSGGSSEAHWLWETPECYGNHKNDSFNRETGILKNEQGRAPHTQFRFVSVKFPFWFRAVSCIRSSVFVSFRFRFVLASSSCNGNGMLTFFLAPTVCPYCNVWPEAVYYYCSVFNEMCILSFILIGYCVRQL